MTTGQDLRLRLASLNDERRRLRAVADLNGPLQREVVALRERERQLVAQAESLAAQGQSNAQLADSINQVRRQLATRESQLAQARVRLAEIAEEIQTVDNQIAALDRGVQQTARDDQGSGTVSTGTTQVEAQRARDDRAGSQAPTPAPQVIDAPGRIRATPAATTPSNAAPVQQAPTTGTEGATRPSSQTQAIPPPTAAAPIQPGSPSLATTQPPSAPAATPAVPGTSTPAAPGSPGVSTPGSAGAVSPTPSLQRGAAAAGDDNTGGTVARINNIFGGDAAVIKPRGNVLDQYANYTYNFSIYLSNNEEYRSINSGQRVSLRGANLLMQSGGAPRGSLIPGDQIDPNIELPQQAQQEIEKNLGRNQYMPLDFYIDDVVLRSVLPGKGTGGAHNTVSLLFKIYEPNGVTFLDRLATATRQFVRTQLRPDAAVSPQGAQSNNYSAQVYLMVIRFYGYDADGRLVRGADPLEAGGGGTEPGFIVEKVIPFRFTSIKFRLAGRVAEYACEAAALRDYAPSSQTRGIIPYNIELTSVSLKDLLGVNLTFGTANSQRDTQGRESSASGSPTSAQATAQGSPPTAAPTSGTAPSRIAPRLRRNLNRPDATTGSGGASTAPSGAFLSGPDQSDAETARLQRSANVSESSVALPGQSSGAPPKATAAPRPTLVTGLTAALNAFQAELVRNETYTYPDVYEIVINENVIKEATLQPAEAAAGLKSVPMTSAQTAGAQKLGIKQSVERDAKNVAATAGMSIIQFLDQIVRNSSYIQDQQVKIWTKNALGEWVVKPRTTGASVFAWYRIGMDAVPIRSQGIDPRRGDYAYRITYTITPYAVTDSHSAWFPGGQYNGTHKRYDYWFTGLNTSIINYEQDYNYLYYVSVNGGQPPSVRTTDYREYTQYAFQARAPENSQGAAGPVFDPAAQAAGALYSPGDTARIKMQIIGDPAWLQQGEILSGIKDLGQINYGPFLADGTINYDSREPLFEVRFNTAGDYDVNTGLMDVKRRKI
jgi:hypothetical protein